MNADSQFFARLTLPAFLARLGTDIHTAETADYVAVAWFANRPATLATARERIASSPHLVPRPALAFFQRQFPFLSQAACARVVLEKCNPARRWCYLQTLALEIQDATETAWLGQPIPTARRV